MLKFRVAVSLLVTTTSRNGVLVPAEASKGPVVFRPSSVMVDVPVGATLVNVAEGSPPSVRPLVIVLVVPGGFAEAAVIVGVEANVKSKSARAAGTATSAVA